MGQSKTTLVATDADAQVSGPVYWNHFKTLMVILAVNSIYFADMIMIIGSGAYARDIAATVGGVAIDTWPAVTVVVAGAAISTPTCQATDYWGRKWFLVLPTALGVVASVVVAAAKSMGMAIVGFTLGGVSFAAIPLLHAVASEVLPRKYRSWAQASVNASIGLGSIFALCLGGRLTVNNPAGFRTYYYIGAGVYAFAAIVTTFFYNPVPRQLQVELTTRQKLRTLDWIAYALFTAGLILLCVGLSYAQNPYPWTNAHVLGPFLTGAVVIIILILYARFIRKDGLLHHALFRDRNFPIALAAVFIEGMAFNAANVFFTYEVSVLFATKMSSFRQSLCYAMAFVAFTVFSLGAGFIVWKTKRVREPAIAAFASFVIFFALMASATATTPESHFWGYVIFYGIGLGLCLTTLLTAAQFSTPPELIAVTSGLMISFRAAGGSIGVAIYDAAFSHGLAQNLVPKVASAVLPLGLSKDELAPLIGDLTAGKIAAAEKLPGVTPRVIGAASLAINEAYVIGFRYAFICGGAFAVVALVATAFLRNPKSEFNAKIDAPIEVIESDQGLESKYIANEPVKSEHVEVTNIRE